MMTEDQFVAHLRSRPPMFHLARQIRRTAAAQINRVMRGALVRMRTIRASIPNFPNAPYQIQQRAFRRGRTLFRLSDTETRWRGSMGGRKRIYYEEKFGNINKAQHPFSQRPFHPSNRMIRRF